MRNLELYLLTHNLYVWEAGKQFHLFKYMLQLGNHAAFLEILLSRFSCSSSSWLVGWFCWLLNFFFFFFLGYWIQSSIFKQVVQQCSAAMLYREGCWMALHFHHRITRCQPSRAITKTPTFALKATVSPHTACSSECCKQNIVGWRLSVAFLYWYNFW